MDCVSIKILYGIASDYPGLWRITNIVVDDLAELIPVGTKTPTEWLKEVKESKVLNLWEISDLSTLVYGWNEQLKRELN
tara:strand:+ start:173 stop:409 length:237 start_codon:yes stop_codon:yes gene_type:complete